MCSTSNTTIEFSSDITFYILLIALEWLFVQGKKTRTSFNLKQFSSS